MKLGADGMPDFSDAYATGIGEWDKVSITYGYQDFAPGTDEHAALNKILTGRIRRGTALSHRSGRASGELVEQRARISGIPARTRWTNWTA